MWIRPRFSDQVDWYALIEEGKPRFTDVLWTGERFVAALGEYEELTTGPPCEQNYYLKSIRGGLTPSETRAISSWPTSCSSPTPSGPDIRRAIPHVHDLVRPGTMHAVDVDATGDLTVVSNRELVHSRCSEGGSAARAVAAGTDLLVAYYYDYESWYYDISTRWIKVDRITPGGEWVQSFDLLTDGKQYTFGLSGDERGAWSQPLARPWSGQPPARCATGTCSSTAGLADRRRVGRLPLPHRNLKERVTAHSSCGAASLEERDASSLRRSILRRKRVAIVGRAPVSRTSHRASPDQARSIRPRGPSRLFGHARSRHAGLWRPVRLGNRAPHRAQPPASRDDSSGRLLGCHLGRSPVPASRGRVKSRSRPCA